MSQETAMKPDTKQRLNKRNKIFFCLCVAAIGIAVFAWGFYLYRQNNGDVRGELLMKAAEFLILAVSLPLLYDWIAKEFDREEYIDSVSSVIRPQSEKLDKANQSLDSLLVQMRSVLNMVSYSDKDSFEARWKNMARRYDHFLLVGDVPVSYLDHISGADSKRKQISVFRTVSERNRGQIFEVMSKFGEEDFRKVETYHIGRFDWGFIAIASNRQGSEADVLVNYSNNPEEPTGYYVYGEAAIALLNSVTSRLMGRENVYFQDESDSGILIESVDMLEVILQHRLKFKTFLNEIRHGIPLKGEEAICQRMERLLSNSKKTLDVTHIARGESIKVLNGAPFKSWLNENYRAVERGVEIKRIFLVRKDEFNNQALQDCMADMKKNKIVVKYCFLDELGDGGLCEDFSIYDGEDLVYISPTSGGAWKEERMEARHSRNRTRVDRYKELFKQLDSLSKSLA